MDDLYAVIAFESFAFSLHAAYSLYFDHREYRELLRKNKNGYQRFDAREARLIGLVILLVDLYCLIASLYLGQLAIDQAQLANPFVKISISAVIALLNAPIIRRALFRERARLFARKEDSKNHQFQTGFLGIWLDVPKGRPLDSESELTLILKSIGDWSEKFVLGDVSRGNYLTAERLDEELSRLKPDDVQIVHLGAHASREGVRVADKWMAPRDFAEQVAPLKPLLVVLMACEGSVVADLLIEYGVRTVVYSSHKLPNDEVMNFVPPFYRCLRKGNSVQQALDNARGKIVNQWFAYGSLKLIGEPSLRVSFKQEQVYEKV